jgi:hypothetical protein
MSPAQQMQGMTCGANGDGFLFEGDGRQARAVPIASDIDEMNAFWTKVDPSLTG